MLLATLLLLIPASAVEQDFILKKGDKAPPFSMRDLDNQMFSLATHLGREPKEPRSAMLMAFFATWCEPCKKEIPIVVDLYKRWKALGVEVVYVGLSQGAKELGPFAKERALPWRVIPDSFGLLARRYGASQLPHLLILDKDGAISFQHRGIVPSLQNMLEQELSRITGKPIPPGAPKVEASAPAASARFSTTLTMARAPSSDGSAERWKSLGVFLGEAAAAEVQLTSATSYEAFEKALGEEKYDLANAGPLLCYQVRDQYEPIAKIERQGAPSYFGIIFANRSSNISALQDLKGKKLALVSERSTSGGLYPQLALLKVGLVPGKDVELVWLGNHPMVAEAVKSGSVEAGGCYEDCRDAVWPDERARAEATKIVAYTEDIPPEAILVRRSLPKETKEKLKKAILAVNKAEGILAQISEGETKPITAFLQAGESDLAAIAKAVEQVEKKATDVPLSN